VIFIKDGSGGLWGENLTEIQKRFTHDVVVGMVLTRTRSKKGGAMCCFTLDKFWGGGKV